MKARYRRNCNALSPEESDSLREKRVFVAGCGGLGGFIIEELGRLGVGHITAADGDVFDETNLNRQLLSSESLVGTPKAEAAKRRMSDVNSEVEVKPVIGFIDEENCDGLIGGHDLVVDALDHVSVRLLLEKRCEALGIPLVHGAIGGWSGQVTTVFPGDGTLELLYGNGGEPGSEAEPEKPDRGVEEEQGNPSFTPAVIASIETAEAVKVLLGRSETLRGKLLTVDLLEQEYDLLEL